MSVVTYAGGPGLASTFSDALNVNGPLNPANWIVITKPKDLPNTSPAWATKLLIGNTSFDGNPGLVTQLCWDGVTAAATNWRTVAFPYVNGIQTSIKNASQSFAQVTALASTLNLGNSGGPGVGWNGTDPSGLTTYFTSFGSLGYQLRKAISDTTFTTFGTSGVFAGGDVMRVSMDASVAGQVTVTLKQNGTVLIQSIDNSASRLTSGLAGIHSLVPGTTGVLEMRTFSCGVGL